MDSRPYSCDCETIRLAGYPGLEMAVMVTVVVLITVVVMVDMVKITPQENFGKLHKIYINHKKTPICY